MEAPVKVGVGIFGVGTYIAAIQVLSQLTLTIIETLLLPILPAVIVAVGSHLILGKIEDVSDRRKKHLEYLVQEAVNPALDALGPSLNSEVWWFIQSIEHGGLAHNDGYRTPIMAENRWWPYLMEHDKAVGLEYQKLTESRKNLIEVYEAIQGELRSRLRSGNGFEDVAVPVDSLESGQLRGWLIVNLILREYARLREQGGTSFHNRSYMRKEKRNGDKELLMEAGRYGVALGSPEAIEKLEQVIRDSFKNWNLDREYDRLKQTLEVMNGHASSLRARLEIVKSEGAPRGRCSKCSFRYYFGST